MKEESGYRYYYRQYQPAKSLENYVKFFYYFHSDDTRPERILPIGTTEITVSLNNGDRNIYINNPATKAYFVKPKALSNVIGVCLQPWALNKLFNIPQSEITDSKLSLYDILSTPYYKLTEQLNGKTNHHDIIQLMQSYLLSILDNKGSTLITDAISFIDQKNGAVDIDTLYKRYHISERRLQQIFNTAVGMSPKKYCQLKRFHHTISQLNSNLNLTDLALSSGYYDQSHFIHEFKSFAGINPGGFLKEKNTLNNINAKAYFSV